MKKLENMLLILSSEEQKEAEAYIPDRLRSLDVRRIPDLQTLAKNARQEIVRVNAVKERLKVKSDRSAKVMIKVSDSALSGLANLIAECNRASTSKQRELKEMQRAANKGSDGESLEVEGILRPSPEEEASAARYINEKIMELSLADLGSFRDACQGLLTWWDSERGQVEDLVLNQFGDVNRGEGRLAIRQKREELQKEILNPFKAFFKELNLHYHKLGKEGPENTSEEEKIDKIDEEVDMASIDALIEEEGQGSE